MIEYGVSRGVYYPSIGPGVPWNGLTSVEESSEGFDEMVRSFDGVPYNYRRRIGHFSGLIQAYTYPEEFYSNVLAQRTPGIFGLSYQTLKDDSYVIHLVYNVLISPSPTVRDQDEIEEFGWSFTTTPVAVPGEMKTAHILVDGTIAHRQQMDALETILYGTDDQPARLPLPEEVIDIFEDNVILQVIDHGDGTYSVIGPDEVILMIAPDTFQITWPSAIFIDAVSFEISSY